MIDGFVKSTLIFFRRKSECLTKYHKNVCQLSSSLCSDGTGLFYLEIHHDLSNDLERGNIQLSVHLVLSITSTKWITLYLKTYKYER